MTNFVQMLCWGGGFKYVFIFLLRICCEITHIYYFNGKNVARIYYNDDFVKEKYLNFLLLLIYRAILSN